MEKNFDMVTTAGAAELLVVHPNTIRNWVKAGKLQAYRRPGKGLQVFLKKQDVIALQTFEPIRVGVETKSRGGKRK